MSLPEKELVEYIKHIKQTLPKTGEKSLRSPKYLLGKQVKEVGKTNNFPKNPSALKLADMFFAYDYITARFKEVKYNSKLMKEEHKSDIKKIENSQTYNTREKKIQFQSLMEEYEDKKINTIMKNIFEEFDEHIKDITFKSGTASNYYYALKPYIEIFEGKKPRYPEFLTGESIIEDTKSDISNLNDEK